MEEIKQRSLVKKLAEIMGEIERIPKSGRNEFHRYDYATEADIVAAVRVGMSQRCLIMFPRVTDMEMRDLEGKNSKQILCTLKVNFDLEDGDSGEVRTVSVIGQGSDASDKASYKAMTGAEKYALLKLFMIPTGDDPETEAPAPRQSNGRQSPPPAKAQGKADPNTDPTLLAEVAINEARSGGVPALEALSERLATLCKSAGDEGSKRIRAYYAQVRKELTNGKAA